MLPEIVHHGRHCREKSDNRNAGSPCDECGTGGFDCPVGLSNTFGAGILGQRVSFAEEKPKAPPNIDKPRPLSQSYYFAGLPPKVKPTPDVSSTSFFLFPRTGLLL